MKHDDLQTPISISDINWKCKADFIRPESKAKYSVLLTFLVLKVSKGFHFIWNKYIFFLSKQMPLGQF